MVNVFFVKLLLSDAQLLIGMPVARNPILLVSKVRDVLKHLSVREFAQVPRIAAVVQLLEG